MGDRENAELVRRAYAAFRAGDLPTLTALIAEDAVWDAPGSGPLSGTKKGRDSILAFFGELMARSGGTFSVHLQEVIGGDEHTVALNHDTAEREGKVLARDAVLTFLIRDGQVTEVRQFIFDPAADDAFWAE